MTLWLAHQDLNLEPVSSEPTALPVALCASGEPGRNRTDDLMVKGHLLYLAELPVHHFQLNSSMGRLRAQFQKSAR
jgi:hypothetical protein